MLDLGVFTLDPVEMVAVSLGPSHASQLTIPEMLERIQAEIMQRNGMGVRVEERVHLGGSKVGYHYMIRLYRAPVGRYETTYEITSPSNLWSTVRHFTDPVEFFDAVKSLLTRLLVEYATSHD